MDVARSDIPRDETRCGECLSMFGGAQGFQPPPPPTHIPSWGKCLAEAEGAGMIEHELYCYL